MKKLYLAYGSNLNFEQMQYRCKTAIPIGKTILENYRLVFKGSSDTCSYLTIEPCEGSIVPVGIYKVGIFDELALNKYEGYPKIYYKKYLKVNINGEEYEAFIYIMNNAFSYHLPSPEYLDICIEGYEDFNFNKEILYKAYEYSKNNKLNYER